GKSELPGDLTCIQKFHFETVPPATLMLAPELCDVGLLARQIKALAAREATVVTDSLDQLRDLIDGHQSELIGSHGVGLAHSRDEIGEFGVDLVLKQRRTGGRAARGDVALVEQDSVHPFTHEVIRDERSGDAASDNSNFAGLVLTKRRIIGENSIFQEPEWV